MHRSYPSRGRTLFEVLCAVGVSASLVSAWQQTHAVGLLAAGGVAALYALVHLFDLRRPKEATAAEPQRIDFEPETVDVVVPMVTAQERVEAEQLVEEAEAVEPKAPRTSAGRRSGSRKDSGRRTKAPKAAKAAEPAPAEQVEAPWPVSDDAVIELAPAPEDEEFGFPPEDEAATPHIAPLFEPEPFARMQRRAFGRRGRL